MDAFFQKRAAKEQPNPELGKRSTSVRTSIRLTREEADWLDKLRMTLRHRVGRYLTYSQVVGIALLLLAEKEGLAGSQDGNPGP
jgi:hypothetical protein